ncbi:MAG: hypothetical protein JWQ09_5978 [Segetibacter sp.]|nr:hypothetical protein [Segetibacter sp.]
MKSAVYFLCIPLSIVVLSSCKKSDGGGSSGGSASPKRPTLTTTVESAVISTSAQTGGAIVSDGGSTITARGVCWNSIAGPTITDSKTTDGSGTGSFTSTVAGLTPYKAYYVRAYATNASGTGYGNEIVVGTLPGLTLTITDIYVTNYVRLCETQITINGFSDPMSLPVTGSGVCWGKSQNPTIAHNKTSTGPVSSITAHFTVNLPLSINSTYYIRAYGTNSAGTTYSNQVTYTTGVDIGLTYAGGVIFYVDNTGQHGLVAATSDQGTAIPLAPGNLFTTSTNTTSYSDGAGNTTKIIAKYGNSYRISNKMRITIAESLQDSCYYENLSFTGKLLYDFKFDFVFEKLRIFYEVMIIEEDKNPAACIQLMMESGTFNDFILIKGYSQELTNKMLARFTKQDVMYFVSTVYVIAAGKAN